MQANDLLEYRNKIIDAFKDNTFSSEYLKKSDNAAYDFTLKNVNKFIQEIRSMEKRINFSFFFFDFHHQLIMQKSLLILKKQIKIKNM